MGWNVFVGVTIFVSFFLLNPQIHSVNAESKVVTDFCNQRKSTEDRSFCLRVFKSKPQSNNAKDIPALLNIGLDLAVSHAKSTQEFIEKLSKDKAINAALNPVLKECLSAYEDALKQLDSIVKELEDDPPMAGYDAHKANDELNRCDNSLTSSKVPHEPISYRHKITVDYSRLCEEIAESI